MDGAITAVSSTSVTISSDVVVGTGTFTSWSLFIVGNSGTSGTNGSSGSSGASGSSGSAGSAGSSVIINNNTNNYVITATGTANTINGESNFTFDGSTVNVTGATNWHTGPHIFNVAGTANGDFQIEGDTDVNLFYADASADAVGIGTNTPTRKLDVQGDYNFVHDPSAKLTSSPSAYGDIVTFGSGTLVAGNLYNYSDTAGSWVAANASATTYSIGMLAIALGTSPTSGMLVRGYARFTSYSGQRSAKLYVSTNSGGITNSAPGSAGQIVRLVGYQIVDVGDTIYFNPSNDWIEL
jgi:hypothetical protein